MTDSSLFDSRIRAVLGPTNTGKTYLAIERMLAHATGMIGFPLRLLARENYDRIVKLRGKASVALVTGEEKIIPANPRWYICTVEAMPLEKQVDFLGIDEIQLCADEDRGHIFTDRLLHARGRHETMFMGSDTMAPLIESLLGDVEIESRSRFSTLRYNGSKKLTRLPPRSAVVAFSVNDVYALAETIRMQNGGTAVVLGALSPRTRNAQVAMYQAGEVDFLVATDAIGMGLNMDVDHVAFANLNKYDGRRRRALTPSEMGQIAGRAGRHMNDGTFGMTNNKPEPDEEIVAAIESHEFPDLKNIFWRNRKLDFNSSTRLLKSLQYKPPFETLIRTRDAEDHLVLSAMNRKEEVLLRAQTPDQVHLLWDICQIPDFRKVLPDNHAEFLTQIYLHLSDDPHLLPEDWVNAQVERLNRDDGDIDTLTARIAHIRTWSYIANRANWLRDPFHWQGKTSEIEDRLSDALHYRLMQRFVDKRASAILRRKKDGDGPQLQSAISKEGLVLVEGHVVGQMQAFRFTPDKAADHREARALTNAAATAIASDADHRVTGFEKTHDNDIHLSVTGTFFWDDVPIAKLRKGQDILHPEIIVLPHDLPAHGPWDQRITKRLSQWLLQKTSLFETSLAPNSKLKPSPALRGLIFQLRENLGIAPASDMQDLLANLTGADRNFLARYKIRLGKEWIFAQKLLNDNALFMRILLFALWHARPHLEIEAPYPALFRTNVKGHHTFYQQGYIRVASFCIRVDHYEAMTAAMRRLRKSKGFDWLKEFGPLFDHAEPTLIHGCLLAMGMVSKDNHDENDRSDHQSLMVIKSIRSTAKKGGKPSQKERSPSKTKTQKSNANTQKSSAQSHSPFAILKQMTPDETNTQTEPADSQKLRIDKWLWYARFFKTRTQAASVVTGGHLRINKNPTKKASAVVKPGDILTFAQGPNIRVIKIKFLGDRRGPAKEAQNLYEDLEPIVKKAPEDKQPTPGKREKGSGRPTKKDRRATSKLRDL